MRLDPGRRLGPYEILSALGAGGMGEVYRARDTRLGRDVAVKVLSDDIAGNARALARFQSEAKAVAALSHPNILALHDVGEADGVPFAVMELLEGETLRARVSRPLPPRKCAEYGAGIARGLAAAHERGIVHRDIKPENLFVTRSGEVKILDFGLARRDTTSSSGVDTQPSTVTELTGPGAVLGTVGYMSPEQVKGQTADHRSDVFSLGAVLFEMLTGTRAFRGETAAETMTAILRDDPTEHLRRAIGLPPAFERLVRRCLEKDPASRFQSARDLAFSLDELTGSAGSGAVAAAPADRPATTRFAVAAAVVAIAALFIGAGRFLARDGHARLLKTRRITFRHGNVLNARFTPDGQSVVYSAAWDGHAADLFTTRVDGTQSRPLGIPGADLLDFSPAGELAVLVRKRYQRTSWGRGTLAVLPLEGGVPRELLEGVRRAAYGPDGGLIALAQSSGHDILLALPDRVLYTSRGLYLDQLQPSPSGDLVVFVEDGRRVEVVDRQGATRTLAGEWNRIRGAIRFTKGGRELLVLGSRAGGGPGLFALGLDGRASLVTPMTDGFVFHDVSREGRLLLEETHEEGRLALLAEGALERDLSWLDRSIVADIARDGTSVLFNENGRGTDDARGVPHGMVFLRRPSDASPLRLGEGIGDELSDDGRFVLARRSGDPDQLALLPVGAGERKTYDTTGLEKILGARFRPGTVRAVVMARGKGTPYRLWAVETGGTRPRAVTPEVAGSSFAVSPDGTFAVASDTEARLSLFPFDGAPRPLEGLPSPLHVLRFSADGKSILVTPAQEYRSGSSGTSWTHAVWSRSGRSFRPTPSASPGSPESS